VSLSLVPNPRRLQATGSSFFLVAVLFASSCTVNAFDTSAPAVLPAATPPQLPVKVLDTVPHDRAAFTEGLAFANGKLFESSGEYRESFLREVDLATGKPLRQLKLEDKYFGEGLAIFNGKIYQLTWREQICFVYDLATFRKIREIKYDGEGWGLTSDGKSLIMSDGSEWIRFRDPTTFTVRRSIRVVYQGKPLTNLNELEFIDGKIWANVWGTDLILRLDPADGRIVDVLDASGVFPASQRPNDPNAVLNGIAYDDKSKSIYITGKRWPRMYRIQAP
jgi:glutaminyl-peptide cyclotransferase